MLKALMLIALTWTMRGKDLRHVRRTRCEKIHGEDPGCGYFLTTSSFTMSRTHDGSTVTAVVTTPEEWICPCGAKPSGPGRTAGQRHPGELP
jgi:hypothetical protein